MDRETNVYMAKVAEQTERYDEMVAYMKEVAALKSPLSLEERNLVSVAYKNQIGARRASWRIVTSLEDKQADQGNTDRVKDLKTYKDKIEKELSDICMDIIGILTDCVIPFVSDADKDECLVFYHKMKGDYYRYLAEFTTDAVHDKATEDAMASYEEAVSIASALSATNPIRLGLALNYSVFYFEIKKDAQIACKIAQTAFDNGVAILENVDEDAYRDSMLIMQLLRDNMMLWSQSTDE